MAYGTVTASVTPTIIIPANTLRHSIIISNESTTVPVYFGVDNSISSTNAPSIQPGGNFCEDSGATNTWKGPIYVVTAGVTTADVRWWERTQG
jgi:hypothetical protein